MKPFLFLFIFLFSTGSIFAQGCIPYITLQSQAEVDNLPNLFPDCTEIEFDLQIGASNTPTDIHDLTPLLLLEKVNRNIYIRDNPLLTSLAGLDNLQEVGEIFSIGTGTPIENFQGLNRLKTLERFSCSSPALQSLEGLDSLHTVYLFSIGQSSLLSNFSNFPPHLDTIPLLFIGSLPNVTDLSGLVSR
ncbi:MAG: hypothetical protein AAFV80_05540 [Bacteroidota bacterium]